MKKASTSIFVRNLDAAVVAKLDQLAKERNLSRSEFIRRYLERLAVTPQLQEKEDQYAALAKQTIGILQVMQTSLNNIESEVRHGG